MGFTSLLLLDRLWVRDHEQEDVEDFKAACAG
jgi:hypothetical protein